jgi:hypothetical protein
MRDEIPLIPQVTLQVFDKWVVAFVGIINPPSKISGERYIITAKEYYGQEAVVPLVYMIPSQCIVATTKMTEKCVIVGIGVDLGFNASVVHQQNPKYMPFWQHL